MEKIKSFKKDHNALQRGFYLSGEQNGIKTFDLRFKKPNEGDYLEIAAMHSTEHLLATVLRNSDYKNNIVYFGPMGCRTGFYLLTTDIDEKTVKQLLLESLEKVEEFQNVPGAEKAECGNFREHDLQGAKDECRAYLLLLKKL